MLWYKKPRSQSSPATSTSTTKLEHHLTTMEEPTTMSTPLPCASSGQAEAPSAAMATEDADPTRSPSLETPLPTTNHSTLKDDAPESSTSSKYRRFTSETAKRSRPHLLILLTCVSCLLFHFMGLDLGVQLIEGYTKPRLLRANVQLTCATVHLIRGNVLENQYDQLLGTTLEPRYLEDYEHCLARGLREADQVYDGLDFTRNPEIRNSTMDWVANNCDRLAFTPQVYNSNFSNIWRAVYHARRATMEVFNLFKYRIALLSSHVCNRKPLAFDASFSTYSRVPVAMPRGFTADCEGRSRCQLIFTGRTHLDTTREALGEALDKAHKDAKKWNLPYQSVFCATRIVMFLLATLQMFVGSAYAIADFHAEAQLAPSTLSCWARFKQMRSFPRFNLAMPQGDDLVFLGSFVNVMLYVLLNTQLEYFIVELGSFVLPVASMVFIWHLFGIVWFLGHTNSTESLSALTQAAKDLYLLAHGVDVPDLPGAMPDASLVPCTRTPSCSLKPFSKIGAKYISPLTPISEDLHQERRAMHEEQGKHTVDDDELEGYATESEDGLENDVHRDAATPTSSEDEREWAIVEE